MHFERFTFTWACGLIICIGSVASAETYDFNALGGPAGATSFESSATGVSADGSVVVGSVRVAGQPRQGYRWTRETGMVELGHLPGNSSGAGARGVSATGEIVVGEDGSFPPSGFRWTSDGMTTLGNLPGGSAPSSAQGVSADGSVIVGLGSSPSGLQAFRWTGATGMVGLGALAGGSFNSQAAAVSGDGSVIVGNSNSVFGPQGFRWTQADGMAGLGDLPGGAFNSTALAVSMDGSTTVGNGTSASGSEAFRWTAAKGMEGLGGVNSRARGVSGDGSLIVGDSAGKAVVWTAANEMVDLRALLLSRGVTDVEDWTLSVGAAISADGRTIVGTGTSPTGRSEAWIATIPEPATVMLETAGAIVLVVWQLRRSRALTERPEPAGGIR